MTLFLTAAVSLLALEIPYHLLAYYPFRGYLRFPAWKIIFLVAAIQIMQALLYGHEIVSGNSGRMVELSFSPLYMAIYFFCVKDNRPKVMFLYLFVTDYVIILRGLAVFLESRFFYREGMVFYSLRSSFIHLAIFFASLPFMLRFFAHARDQAFRVHAPLFWRTAWLLPAFTTAIVMAFTADFSPSKVSSLRFLFTRILLLLSVFVIYSILLQSLEGIRRQAALTEQAAMQEHLLAAWRLQYQQLLRHMDETKTARHDLRQHLGVIRAYVEQQEMGKLLKYLESYEKTLPADTRKTFCANFAANAILTYYAEKAAPHKIDFDVCCPLPENLPINEPEICALLGNLLENAVDACLECQEGAAFIRVRCECRETSLALTVDNSCQTRPAAKNGRLLSSKHEGYGTGTYSVKATAEKYNGTATFEYRDGVFYSSVLLCGNPKNRMALP